MPKAKRNERELPIKGLTGHDLRRVQKLNATLRDTRSRVQRAGEGTDSVALLLAETRVLVLKMGRKEFGRAAGMHFHAVKNAETPGSQPQHESLSRVYRMWQKLIKSKQLKPTDRKAVEAASARLIGLLVPEFDEEGESFRRSVDGLYQTWMYQLGRNAFEAASRKTNRQNTPLTYGALWQRRHARMVPDFAEVRTIASTLSRDLTLTGQIWSEHKAQQLISRGMDLPLVRFIVDIQLAFPKMRMTAASVAHHLKVRQKTAQAIKNGQLVKYDLIRAAAEKVVPRRELKEFERQWSEAWLAATTHESFSTAFPRICHENGWSNHMLATLLKVRPPEQRTAPARKGKADRIESYRPSAEIRRMYQENTFSGQAPAKAAIDLIADRAKYVGENGENQAEYLTRLFLSEVEQKLLHKGSSAHFSPIRRHRVFCGVQPDQLADAAGYGKGDILLLERGRLSITDAEQRRLIKLIEAFPQQKVADALQRLEELTTPPTEIIQAVIRLRDRHGGYIPLSRLLHVDDDRRFNLSPVHLKNIESGREVPSLPLLRHLISHGGTEFTDGLLLDWYNRLPQCLIDDRKLRWHRPLVRGFGIIVFERWHSLRDFWEDQFEGDFSYPTLTRNFQQLNGSGPDFTWAAVSRYLNAAGIGIDDPRRTFLQLLYEIRDKFVTPRTAKQRQANRKLVQNTLAEWRRQLTKSSQNPRDFEHRLGLSMEERGKSL